MIFVTVGTHEQPFNRLLKEVDRLKGRGKLEDHVFIQTGYSTYPPQFCEWKEFIGFKEMMQLIEKARLVIAHGGPGSIMPAIYLGKMPIVVPRQKKFNEHVDNHQVSFCKKIEEKGKIIAVYEIEELEQKIRYYNDLIVRLKKVQEVGFKIRAQEIVESLELIGQQITKRTKHKHF